MLEQQKPLVLTEAKPDAALFDLMNRVTYRVFAYVRIPRRVASLSRSCFLMSPYRAKPRCSFLFRMDWRKRSSDRQTAIMRGRKSKVIVTTAFEFRMLGFAATF